MAGYHHHGMCVADFTKYNGCWEDQHLQSTTDTSGVNLRTCIFWSSSCCSASSGASCRAVCSCSSCSAAAAAAAASIFSELSAARSSCSTIQTGYQDNCWQPIHHKMYPSCHGVLSCLAYWPCALPQTASHLHLLLVGCIAGHRLEAADVTLLLLDSGLQLLGCLAPVRQCPKRQLSATIDGVRGLCCRMASVW
jgi:hypothetical protein